MARFSRLDTLNTILSIGLVPVFYNDDIDTAKNIVKACAAGGARVVEFTNRGDFAYQVFAELERYAASELPGVILGVGSILEPYTAALYIANGANFVVGPTLNADVARLCNRRKIPYSPGCGSATEIQTAEEFGCEIVKVFPGDCVGGPGFVKAIRGPMPRTLIMPTGGVDASEDSLRAWFGAGAACVGMGTNLITKEFINAKNYAGITENIRKTITLIAALKK